MRRSTRRWAAFVPAAALAAALGTAELGLRAWRGAPPAEPVPKGFEYAYEAPFRPGFVCERAAGGRLCRPAREGSAAAAFAMPKPPGVRRIFVVGGSVGLPLGHPFMRDPQASWRRLARGETELIAAVMPGYDSRRDLANVREVLRYEPDLVVVMSGNNEFFGTDIADPRLFWLNHALRRSWLARAVQDLRRPKPGNPAVSADRDLHVLFERNLRAMAAAARKAGVPLAFATLPANLRDLPPTWNDLARPEPPRGDPAFAAGWSAWESGDAAAARRRWAEYAAKRPRDPFGAYFIAKACDRLGRFDEARRLYGLAADLSGPPEPRTSPRRNRVIRAVAAETGAGLVDLEPLIARAAADGIPGSEVVYDSCHVSQRFYPLIAAEILAAGAALGALEIDERALAAARTALARPPYPQALRALEARKAMRGVVTRLLRTEPPTTDFDESALGVMGGALRLSPRTWTEALASREALVRTLADADGGFDLSGGLDARPRLWAAVWRHLAEALRRQGDRARADRLARRAESLDSAKRRM